MNLQQLFPTGQYSWDNDVSHTAGTGTFTGTVTLLWAIIGDK